MGEGSSSPADDLGTSYDTKSRPIQKQRCRIVLGADGKSRPRAMSLAGKLNLPICTPEPTRDAGGEILQMSRTASRIDEVVTINIGALEVVHNH